ncbi:MAG TPA: hypothetical protein VJ978_10960 [Nitriliruptoraceae bacterium]|nr:hypothetical protein [Nitriliruptoraceae bacterium]
MATRAVIVIEAEDPIGPAGDVVAKCDEMGTLGALANVIGSR